MALPTRNTLLHIAACICATLVSPAALTADQSHGPIVGAVTHNSAKVFVRTDANASVQIQYSQSADLMGRSRTTRTIPTNANRDFTAIANLRQLRSETRYYYQVLVDGIPQQSAPFPTFQTFPQPGSEQPFSFAVIVDVGNDQGATAPAYARVLEEQPAFVMQIGDWDHRDPDTLSAMRTMHRSVRGPETASGVDFLTHIGPNLPLFHVWDDHDYGMDNGDKTFAAKADALRAFQEYFPTPSLPNRDAGIWHSFVYGNAEFFMLDVRSNRDPNDDPDGPDKSLLDGDDIANGQKEWLFNGLLNSTARWKFLATGVCFNPTCKPNDGWGAFPDEWAEVVAFINDNAITGVIAISGDLHTGGAIDDGTNAGVVEINVPHTNMPSVMGYSGTPGTWSEGLIPGTDMDGYALITVGTEPHQVLLEAKGYDGALHMGYIVSEP